MLLNVPLSKMKSVNHDLLIFLIGFFAVIATFIPICILQQDCSVTIHDQLDGEVLAYMLQAKHITEDSFPEFLSGTMPKTTLTPASIGTLLFYLFLSPFQAFTYHSFFVIIIAYLSLYFLLLEWKIPSWVAAISSVLYALLPFYTVYGLSVIGYPLLFLSISRLYLHKKTLPSFLLVALFGLYSSPVLSGYTACFILFIFAVFLSIKKHPAAKSSLLLLILLISAYFLLYFDLISEVFGASKMTSHKEDYLLSGSNEILQPTLNLFLNGHTHAQACHQQILPWILLVAIFHILFAAKLPEKDRTHLKYLVVLLLSAAFIAFFYAIIRFQPIIDLRMKLGGLFVSFQIDRFYWMYPFIWYASLGLSLSLLSSRIKQASSFLLRSICFCVLLSMVFISATSIYSNSHLKKNIERMKIPPTYIESTWHNFFSTELFDEIAEYIGKPKDSYRVGSIALYPSVPLYNGFQCIDGYSNNYDISYKWKFREAIQAELEKSTSLASYFDTWGNRCYLFSSEIGKRYYVTRNEKTPIENIKLSSSALKELNCNYVFSGKEILYPENSGLRFLQSFMRRDLPYHIYLYEVID